MANSSSSSDLKSFQFNLEHSLGGGDFSPAGTFTARLKSWSHGGQTLTKLRFLRNALTGAEKEAFEFGFVGKSFQFNLEHSLGSGDFSPAGTFTARLKSWSHGSQTLTKLRFLWNALTGAEMEAFEATPLLLTVAVIEVDSKPAVFGVTRDPFIFFTSNIFAISELTLQLDEGKGMAKMVADVKDGNKRTALHLGRKAQFGPQVGWE